MLVQMLGVFGGAPCVVLCGMTQSLAWLIASLTVWGFFKGLYDANIFASLFDVIRPEVRGSAAGFMNTVGWLGGGGSAPIVIAWLASAYGLGGAIAMASAVYLLAGMLLFRAARRNRRMRQRPRWQLLSALSLRLSRRGTRSRLRRKKRRARSTCGCLAMERRRTAGECSIAFLTRLGLN